MCTPLWVYASGCPSWHLCWVFLREWHNLRMSVRGCEFAQGFWGPRVGKAVGEWALVCTDEWGSGWGWYSLAGCYDSPLPPQASPLFTRIESPCTHPLPNARAHTQTHTCFAAPAWHRGKWSGGEGSHRTRAKNRGEMRGKGMFPVWFAPVYSLRQSVAKKKHFFYNLIK